MYAVQPGGRVTVAVALAEASELIRIPIGVLHGFYFAAPSIAAYGLTDYFDVTRELGCHWSSPGVELRWPFDAPPLLSQRDQDAGSFAEMYAAWLAVRGARP